MPLAQFIDHTVLKQTTGLQDVYKVCAEAKEYGFAAICIPPVYVKLAARELENTAVRVATVIGFPFGYHLLNTKIEEARQAVSDGADELDMVMNLTALKNRDWGYLENEVCALLEITKKHEVVLKVIIESGILTD